MKALIVLTCLVILAGAAYLGWREFSSVQAADARSVCLKFAEKIRLSNAPGADVTGLPDALAGARDCAAKGLLSEADFPSAMPR